MQQNDTWEDHSIATMVSNRVLTVVVDSQYFTISNENERFEMAKQALREKNLPNLMQALKPIELVKAKLAGTSAKSLVTIEEDAVLYNGVELHGVLIDRILEFAREGYDYKPLASFLENLMLNPSRTVVTEFYEWLENAATPMPITEDGCFLAYKKVRSNFHDGYSGKIDFSVGKTVEVARNQVDDNRNNTCSYGLHFCSLGYLPSFGMGGANVVVIVKINPKDVVAFPQDHRTSKGRTCKMEVIGLHEKGDSIPAWENRGYVDTRREYARTTIVADKQDFIALDGFSQGKAFITRTEARNYRHNHGGDLIDRSNNKKYEHLFNSSGSSYNFRWGVVK